MGVRAPAVSALLLVSLLAAASARAAGDPGVAALQVALHERGVYQGPIDGLRGASTDRAILRFQRRHRLAADGLFGPHTRRALGRFGRHRLGSRLLRKGVQGWDVAALQFLLAQHGFPSGSFDGDYGDRTARAVRRFQRFAGLARDGRAGPATLVALHRTPPAIPIPLSWPLQGTVTAPFGPRDNRFHAGIDIAAATGTPVAAAASGRISFAGRDDGYGLLVVVAHAGGVRTLYAHLSGTRVRVGQRVRAGGRIGSVGATGNASGPHLHFEARVRGAAVDPIPSLR
jgi:peptidoglycan hydrolase-like protein with peptidoglycan-binding domain